MLNKSLNFLGPVSSFEQWEKLDRGHKLRVASFSVEILSRSSWMEGSGDISWATLTSPIEGQSDITGLMNGTMWCVLHSPWSHLAKTLDTSLVKLLHLLTRFHNGMEEHGKYSPGNKYTTSQIERGHFYRANGLGLTVIPRTPITFMASWRALF